MLTWIGVSWRTASSARRSGLRALDPLAPGAVAVHTCARDAWLTFGGTDALFDALLTRGIGPEEIEVRVDRAAVQRLFTVGVGLDSAVQGEADVGRQVRAELGRRVTPLGRVLDHVLARLLRQGRLEGWVREGRGVASLAARALDGCASVGVVGAGQLGTQLARLLGPRCRLYSRTPREGVQPLTALAAADAWAVASAAGAAWFRPPGECGAILDLGHPAQVIDDPRRVSLDTLLASADARLDPAARRAAGLAVARATDEVFARLARRPEPADGLSP